MTIRRVTTASLVSTDGTVTHYGIYQANLHFNLRNKPFIDLNCDTLFITTVTKDRNKDGRWSNDELAQRYLEMARPYATSGAPAFTFTDCPRCYGTDPECHCKSNNPNLSANQILPLSQELLLARFEVIFDGQSITDIVQMDATNQWEDSEVSRDQVLAMKVGDIIHFGGGASPDGTIRRIDDHSTARAQERT